MGGNVAGPGGGRAGEDDDDLPARVEAGIIVMIELRRGEAEAGEDERRRDRVALLRERRRDRHLDAVAEGLAGARQVEGQRAAARPVGPLLEGDALEEAAARRRALEAQSGELLGDILGGDLMAAGAGLAAFEQVVGEERHVGPDALLGGGGGGRLGESGGGKGEGRDGGDQADEHEALLGDWAKGADSGGGGTVTLRDAV
jgi:hypothetical protein